MLTTTTELMSFHKALLHTRQRTAAYRITNIKGSLILLQVNVIGKPLLSRNASGFGSRPRNRRNISSASYRTKI